MHGGFYPLHDGRKALLRAHMYVFFPTFHEGKKPIAWGTYALGFTLRDMKSIAWGFNPGMKQRNRSLSEDGTPLKRAHMHGVLHRS